MPKTEGVEAQIQVKGAALLVLPEAEERIQKAFEMWEGELGVSSQLEAVALVLSLYPASSVSIPWTKASGCFSAQQWMDWVDVLQEAVVVLPRAALVLLLEVCWALVVQNAVKTLGLRDRESCFLRPSSHLPPSSALAFHPRRDLLVAAVPLSLHCLPPYHCCSSLDSPVAGVRALTGVQVLSPCQEQAAHCQSPALRAQLIPFPL